MILKTLKNIFSSIFSFFKTKKEEKEKKEQFNSIKDKIDKIRDKPNMEKEASEIVHNLSIIATDLTYYIIFLKKIGTNEDLITQKDRERLQKVKQYFKSINTKSLNYILNKSYKVLDEEILIQWYNERGTITEEYIDNKL